MDNLFKGIAFAALSLAPLGSVASAQDTTQQGPGTEAAQDGDIIVTAPREVREEVQDFVEAVIKPPQGGRFAGQMSRIVGAICPKVFGLSEANNAAVEKRMRGVALASDMTVGEEGCDPNAFVILAEDGPSLIQALRSKSNRAFGDIPIRQRQKLEAGDGPVYSWKVIDSVPAGSTRRPASAGTAAAVAGSGIGPDALKSNTSRVQSRYRRSTEEGIIFSVLLIEHEGAAGLSLLQLADYAAVSSFMDAQSSFNSESISNSTILTLFEDRKIDLEPPEQVTVWDLAVLHALYNSPANVSASVQMSAILQQVERTMAAEKAAAEAAERQAAAG